MTDTPEMVKRVARASFAHWRANCDRLQVHMDRPRTFDEMPEGELAFALNQARAVIAAMREPTEAMQLAGATTDVEVAHTADHRGRCLTPNHAWRAMIDAALAEKP